jgi:hypothetical protein
MKKFMDYQLITIPSSIHSNPSLNDRFSFFKPKSPHLNDQHMAISVIIITMDMDPHVTINGPCLSDSLQSPRKPLVSRQLGNKSHF